MKINNQPKKNDSVHLKALSKEFEIKEEAYNTGRIIARKWIHCASYREIKDVLPRSNSHHDTNYFALMRNTLFISIEKIFPKETKSFKWFNNVDFMRGWREEVIFIWEENTN